MERPALQRLLADIRAGLIDVVVVYKVDRLTRSLADFAKMVELFDAHRVSFVAVTQQFNTTTSMGRLTLNVLLVVRAVRARSHRRAHPRQDRRLQAQGNVDGRRRSRWDTTSASAGSSSTTAKPETVRQIFERYLELGSVRLLKRDLDQRGIVSGLKYQRTASSAAGSHFRAERSTICCPTQSTWARSATRMNATPGSTKPSSAANCGSGSRIGCATGRSAGARGARPKRREVRLQASCSMKRASLCMCRAQPKAIAAIAITSRENWSEAGRKVRSRGGDYPRPKLSVPSQPPPDKSSPTAMPSRRRSRSPASTRHRLPSVLKSAQAWSERLRVEREAAAALADLIERTDLSRDGIRVTLKVPIPPAEEQKAAPPLHIVLTKFVPMQMKRRGVEMRMVLEGDATAVRVDLPLLKAVGRARRWSQDLIAGRVRSVSEIARREELDRRSVHRLLRLGFLSPRIVEAIAEGRQPPDLTAIGLSRRVDLPLLWRAQEQALGIR